MMKPEMMTTDGEEIELTELPGQNRKQRRAGRAIARKLKLEQQQIYSINDGQKTRHYIGKKIGRPV